MLRTLNTLACSFPFPLSPFPHSTLATHHYTRSKQCTLHQSILACGPRQPRPQLHLRRPNALDALPPLERAGETVLACSVPLPAYPAVEKWGLERTADPGDRGAAPEPFPCGPYRSSNEQPTEPGGSENLSRPARTLQAPTRAVPLRAVQSPSSNLTRTATDAVSPRLHDIDPPQRVVRSLTGCGTDWGAPIPLNETETEVDFESASDLQSDASVSKTLQTFNDLYIQGDFIGALIPLNETETDNSEDVNARNLGYNCDTTAGSPRLHDIDTLVRVVRSSTGCGTDWPYSPRYPCRQVAQVETHVAVSICGPGFESRWTCDRLANTIQGIKNRCAWSR
ncbi:hypothetical protein EDC01DRAFT_753982 [Geopyxis carbonaria]|nr:hypothetical protein EDC01DRAFT_753982 [Geopyxis carbonaria]